MTNLRLVPVVLSLAAAGAAQVSPAPLQAASNATADRIAVHGHPGDAGYGLWAAGAAYKASFHGDPTFVPCLGRSYPHNQPFAWRTTSIRVGAHELLPAEQAPATVRGDFRVEYQRGEVIEAYDVLAHGLEQTFVFAQRPAGHGDLRIRGAVATALQTEAVERAAHDLVFRDANGTPIVRYGKALAVDADGDVFAMTTTCSDGSITLTLAAADLARAHFPLVVDPLLAASSVVQVGTVDDVGETDVATETLNTGYTTACCYTRHFSATDADIVCRVSPVSLGGGQTLYSDLAATASADHGRVAFCAATNRWVAVYQNLILSSQQMQLRAAMFAGGAPGAQTTFSLPHLVAVGTHEWRPVVGGIVEGGAGTDVLVAYQQENGTATFANTATSRVMGMLFDTSTTNGSWSPAFTIQGSASDDVERPSVNRAATGGAAFSWFVVCQSYANNIAGDDWDLIGRQVTNTGAVSASAWISSLGTTHKLGPVVDGRAGRYAVAFATASPSIGKNLDVVGNEIRCERVDWQHGAATQDPAGDWPVQTLQTNQFRILEATGIAFNGNSRSHWGIAWRSSSTSPALYATRVGHRGAPLQNPDLLASTGVEIPGPASVLHNDRIGYTTFCYMTASTTAQVWSRRFDEPVPAAVNTAASGCALGTLSWDGVTTFSVIGDAQRIGCEFAGPRITGAPANGLHLLFVATAPANMPIVDPIVGNNCSLLVPLSGPDYLGNMPLAIGATATWTLPLPEYLPPMTVYFQDWVLNPADNRFYGSNRIDVPLAK